LKDEPAVAVEAVLTDRWVAAAALTAMALVVPVTELATVSVAVTVWLPPVLRVTETVPVPLVKVVLLGRTADPSLLVKWTVPE
jgi:hypothetical protein